ncbi:hypothetical protein AVDCRST_MAG92-210 [uncultured Coleofasciculus sp.]|uniref:Uncharacterized protein n=1 Tax=uncultured Coleofasciculus sp. TaxID=1267456 RepID=A0A6J4H645_9CYAN|nr:hypothetical protein AVDCRST_MAG92-210 [uncultured Coleofasciculus sp.]
MLASFQPLNKPSVSLIAVSNNLLLGKIVENSRLSRLKGKFANLDSFF